MGASMYLSDCSNRQIVMLLIANIPLIKNEFVFVIKLLVHGLIMMINTNLAQVIRKKIVSLAGLRVINPHVCLVIVSYQILLPLRSNWDGDGGGLS